MTLPPDAMAQLFEAVPANDLPEVPEYNVCPTTRIHAVRAGEDGTRQLTAMRWGYIPHWYKAPNDGPLLINARAETVAEKPAFRAAARERRCLIPADGFYEWERHDKVKLPWFIHRADGEPMVFAGVWQVWERGEERHVTCAIVTIEADANPAMAAVHNRIPVILEPEDWGKWLGEEGRGAATLMRCPPAETIGMHRVGTEVNSNRAKGPDLIRPLLQA